MSAYNNGGPAFPRPQSRAGSGVITAESQEGMTLRDWFAGQALAGRQVNRQYQTWTDMAADCYEIADAMLSARKGSK